MEKERQKYYKLSPVLLSIFSFFLHISSPLPFMLRGIIQYSFLFWLFHKLEVCLNVHMFGKYQVESKTLKRSGEKNQFK